MIRENPSVFLEKIHQPVSCLRSPDKQTLGEHHQPTDVVCSQQTRSVTTMLPMSDDRANFLARAAIVLSLPGNVGIAPFRWHNEALKQFSMSARTSFCSYCERDWLD